MQSQDGISRRVRPEKMRLGPGGEGIHIIGIRCSKDLQAGNELDWIWFLVI